MNKYFYNLGVCVQKGITLVVLIAFLLLTIFPYAYAQVGLNLPPPDVMVRPSFAFVPACVKGLKIYPQNPFKFDFVVDTGNTTLSDEEFKEESEKLIKYFMASLTVPEDEIWVNLSPYEKDRIIPEAFSQTDMGKDLLAQDYILKQLTSSLMYPEDELGQKFWDEVYTKAYEKYGVTEIPVNTFNKVWIVPEKAVVYTNKDMAFVVEAKLKVLLEEDYLAMSGGKKVEKVREVKNLTSNIASDIIRQIIIPAIEHEVNTGKNFAALRQIYNSMILATWFKRNLKQSILGKVYVGTNKVKGIDLKDKNIKEKIYQQYLEAFKKGVYNYVKEDFDPVTQQIIPRKYFSGGFFGGRIDEAMTVSKQPAESIKEVVNNKKKGELKTVLTVFNFSKPSVTSDKDEEPEILEFSPLAGSKIKGRFFKAVVFSVALHVLFFSLTAFNLSHKKDNAGILPQQVIEAVFVNLDDLLPKQSEGIPNTASGSLGETISSASENVFDKETDISQEYHYVPLSIKGDLQSLSDRMPELFKDGKVKDSERQSASEGKTDFRSDSIYEAKSIYKTLERERTPIKRDFIKNFLGGPDVLDLPDIDIPEGKSFAINPIQGIDGAYEIAFSDRRRQNGALLASSVFKEHPKYQGKFLSQEELRIIYSNLKHLGDSNFGVQDTTFEALNFTSRELVDSFNTAIEEGKGLTTEQEDFINECISKGIFIKEDGKLKVAKEKKGSMIAYPKNTFSKYTEDRLRTHEIGHVLFYSDPQYRKAVEKIWNNLDKQTQGLFTKMLILMKYHPNSHMAEFAEYLNDPDLFLEHLLKLDEQGSVYEAERSYTKEERNLAYDVSREFLEHRMSPSWGYYIKDDKLKMLKELIPKLRAEKVKALKRTGRGDTLGDANLGVLDGCVNPDQGIPGYRNLQVLNLDSYEGSKNDILNEIKQTRKYTPKQIDLAAKKLKDFISNSGHKNTDIFRLSINSDEPESEKWSVEFKRNEGQISLQKTAEDGLKDVLPSQDSNEIINALYQVLQERPWGENEGLRLTTPVNIDGILFDFNIEINVVTSSIKEVGAGLQKEEKKWNVVFRFRQPNRTTYWGGHILGLGEGAELNDAFENAKKSLSVNAMLNGFSNDLNKSNTHVSDIEGILKQIQEVITSRDFNEKYETYKIDTVRKIDFEGNIYDLRFIHEKSEYGNCYTKIGIEIPPGEDDLSGVVFEGLGVDEVADTREGSIEKAYKALKELIDNEEYRKLVREKDDAMLVEEFPFYPKPDNAMVSTEDIIQKIIKNGYSFVVLNAAFNLMEIRLQDGIKTDRGYESFLNALRMFFDDPKQFFSDQRTISDKLRQKISTLFKEKETLLSLVAARDILFSDKDKELDAVARYLMLNKHKFEDAKIAEKGKETIEYLGSLFGMNSYEIKRIVEQTIFVGTQEKEGLRSVNLANGNVFEVDTDGNVIERQSPEDKRSQEFIKIQTQEIAAQVSERKELKDSKSIISKAEEIVRGYLKTYTASAISVSYLNIVLVNTKEDIDKHLDNILTSELAHILHFGILQTKKAGKEFLFSDYSQDPVVNEIFDTLAIRDRFGSDDFSINNSKVGHALFLWAKNISIEELKSRLIKKGEDEDFLNILPFSELINKDIDAIYKIAYAVLHDDDEAHKIASDPTVIGHQLSVYIVDWMIKLTGSSKAAAVVISLMFDGDFKRWNADYRVFMTGFENTLKNRSSEINKIMAQKYPMVSFPQKGRHENNTSPAIRTDKVQGVERDTSKTGLEQNLNDIDEAMLAGIKKAIMVGAFLLTALSFVPSSNAVTFDHSVTKAGLPVARAITEPGDTLKSVAKGVLGKYYSIQVPLLPNGQKFIDEGYLNAGGEFLPKFGEVKSEKDLARIIPDEQIRKQIYDVLEKSYDEIQNFDKKDIKGLVDEILRNNQVDINPERELPAGTILDLKAAVEYLKSLLILRASDIVAHQESEFGGRNLEVFYINQGENVPLGAKVRALSVNDKVFINLKGIVNLAQEEIEKMNNPPQGPYASVLNELRSNAYEGLTPYEITMAILQSLLFHESGHGSTNPTVEYEGTKLFDNPMTPLQLKTTAETAGFLAEISGSISPAYTLIRYVIDSYGRKYTGEGQYIGASRIQYRRVCEKLGISGVSFQGQFSMDAFLRSVETLKKIPEGEIEQAVRDVNKDIFRTTLPKKGSIEIPEKALQQIKLLLSQKDRRGQEINHAMTVLEQKSKGIDSSMISFSRMPEGFKRRFRVFISAVVNLFFIKNSFVEKERGLSKSLGVDRRQERILQKGEGFKDFFVDDIVVETDGGGKYFFKIWVERDGILLASYLKDGKRLGPMVGHVQRIPFSQKDFYRVGRKYESVDFSPVQEDLELSREQFSFKVNHTDTPGIYEIEVRSLSSTNGTKVTYDRPDIQFISLNDGSENSPRTFEGLFTGPVKIQAGKEFFYEIVPGEKHIFFSRYRMESGQKVLKKLIPIPLPMAGQFYIGRDQIGYQYSLDFANWEKDLSLSRAHFSFEIKSTTSVNEYSIKIIDNNSSNGTFVTLFAPTFDIGQKTGPNGHYINGGRSTGRAGVGGREVVIVNRKKDKKFWKSYFDVIAKLDPSLVDDVTIDRYRSMKGEGKGKEDYLERVYEAISEIRFNEEAFEDKKGEEIFVGDAFDEGGVCRHMGILAAAILEWMIDDGWLKGKVYYVRGKGHGWAVYQTKEGLFQVFDAAQNYFGPMTEEYDGSNEDKETYEQAFFREVVTKQKKQDFLDSAMKSREDIGGIDLRADKMKIEEQGEKIDFNMPVDFEGVDLKNIEGFTPVIYQITPTNLPLLLGIKKEEDALQMS